MQQQRDKTKQRQEGCRPRPTDRERLPWPVAVMARTPWLSLSDGPRHAAGPSGPFDVIVGTGLLTLPGTGA